MLHGLIVDEVHQCTSRPLHVEESYNNVDMAVGAGMFAWHQEVVYIARLSSSDVESRQPEDTSIWRTLAADVTPLGAAAPAYFGEEYQEVREYLDLLHECEYDAMRVATMPKAKDLETSTNNSLFVDAWVQAAMSRHFCSTKEGRIGLVPNVCLKGDLVALFLGADVPFVIRPVDARLFVVVGECYIHGIMNGEAFQGAHAQTRDILLK